MKTTLLLLAFAMMACGQPSKAAKKAESHAPVVVVGPKKPECQWNGPYDPLAKPKPIKDANGEWDIDIQDHQRIAVNGLPFVCSPEGRWIVDAEALDARNVRQKHTDDLYWALRTRVLTDTEMQEVRRVGLGLLMREGEYVSVSGLEKRFNDALFLQFQMRLMAEEHKGVPKNPMSGVPCVLGSLCNKTPSYMELPHGGHVDPGKERIQ